MQTFYKHSPIHLINETIPGTVVFISTCNGIESVHTNEVVRVQASSNYSRLYFKDGRSLLVAKVLYHFEELLKLHHFIRVHNSHLLNIKYIKKTQRYNGIKIELITGETISMSRRMKKNVLSTLKEKINCYDTMVV